MHGQMEHHLEVALLVFLCTGVTYLVRAGRSCRPAASGKWWPTRSILRRVGPERFEDADAVPGHAGSDGSYGCGYRDAATLLFVRIG
jgi:hypothetical protein